VAVSTVPQVPLARFAVEHVREWLSAVCGVAAPAATAPTTVAAAGPVGRDRAGDTTQGAVVSADEAEIKEDGAGAGTAGIAAQADVEEEESREEVFKKAVDIVTQYIRAAIEKEAIGGMSGGGSSSSSSAVTNSSSSNNKRPISALSEPSTTAATSGYLHSRAKVPRNDGIFGTVTVSSRLKRYGATAGSSNNSKLGGGGGSSYAKDESVAAASGGASGGGRVAQTAGQLLLRVDYRSLLSASNMHREAGTLIQDATIRRSQYDAKLREYERVSALQATRMRIEDQASTNMQASVLLGHAAASASAGGGSNSSGTGSSGVGGSGGGGASVAQLPVTKRPRTETASVSSVVKVESASDVAAPSAPSAPSAVSGGNDNIADFDLDIDLEELVGGPIASASENRFADLKAVRAPKTAAPASAPAPAPAGVARGTGTGGGAAGVAAAGGVATAAGGSSSSGASTAGVGSSGGSTGSNGGSLSHSTVGGSGGSSSGTTTGAGSDAARAPSATAAEEGQGQGNKKVGMKPRPKFVVLA
jgi:hypothetical protein